MPLVIVCGKIECTVTVLDSIRAHTIYSSVGKRTGSLFINQIIHTLNPNYYENY